MGIRHLAAGLGAASLLLTTGTASAASAREGWYTAQRSTSAVVTDDGRAVVLTFAACKDVRMRVADPIRIARDGTFRYTGALVALPTRHAPRADAPRGRARVTGRFVSRTRMRAVVDFRSSDCRGAFTRVLRYSGPR
jgi:hypothetical protein